MDSSSPFGDSSERIGWKIAGDQVAGIQCTRNKDGRRITRWVDEELLDEMERWVRASPEKIKLRKRLDEHLFGNIKHHMNQGFFLQRGLPSVRAEMILTILAYNIKRVIKIFGVPKMRATLAQKGFVFSPLLQLHFLEKSAKNTRWNGRFVD